MNAPQAPQPTALKLTDTIKSLVNNALTAGKPMGFAYVDDHGTPNLSYRGSVLAYSDTQLALWARNPEGGLVKAIGSHPEVALLYGDIAPPKSFLTFRGHGRIDSTESVRRRVYDEPPELERNADKDRKGVAIIIDLKSVHGLVAGERLQMVAK